MKRRAAGRRPRFAVLALLASLLLASCAAGARTRLQAGDTPVVVLPAHNRSGETLLVSGASLVDRYLLQRPQVSVGEILAAEARYQLAAKGIRVVEGERIAAQTHARTPAGERDAVEIARQAKLAGNVLYMEIRRWEPDASHPDFVIVGWSAALLEPGSAAALWRYDRPSHPIATPGETSIEGAFETAARKAVAELVGRIDLP